MSINKRLSRESKYNDWIDISTLDDTRCLKSSLGPPISHSPLPFQYRAVEQNRLDVFCSAWIPRTYVITSGRFAAKWTRFCLDDRTVVAETFNKVSRSRCDNTRAITYSITITLCFCEESRANAVLLMPFE